MTTKRDEVRDFIQREVKNALSVLVSNMANRQDGDIIRSNRETMSIQIAWHLTEQYRFLELADIMEWRRTRVRR